MRRLAIVLPLESTGEPATQDTRGTFTNEERVLSQGPSTTRVRFPLEHLLMMTPTAPKARAVARAGLLAMATLAWLPACDTNDGNPARESISVPRNGGGGKPGVVAPGTKADK